jgi:hypothetical protein
MICCLVRYLAEGVEGLFGTYCGVWIPGWQIKDAIGSLAWPTLVLRRGGTSTYLVLAR